jgi:UDP-N-acetylglucosamine--dolichyl-phosphate N-acetylglucosaminephosphotransferase
MDGAWVSLSAIFGLVFSLATLPFLMKILRKRGFMTRDMYKPGIVMVPTNGGLIVLFSCFLILLVFPVFMYGLWLGNKTWFGIPWLKTQIILSPLIQMGVLVVAIYGLYGLLDDYLKLQTKLTSRILIPMLFAVPLIEPLYYVTINVPFFGTIDRTSTFYYSGGDIKIINFYRYIIAPVYIMVVANLFNRHSGYNGLQSGLSVIVMLFIILKAVSIGKSNEMIGIAAILGTSAGFWWFNKYPSEVFSGNVGSYVMGAAVGVAIISTGLLIAGLVMLLPHIFDLCLSFYAWARKIKIKKFGRTDKDGNLVVPSNLTLKYILPYYHKMNEKQTVYILYAITIIFCIIGFMMPF